MQNNGANKAVGLAQFLLTIIYSALGDQKHAKRAAHELTRLYPDIEEKARFDLEKWKMQSEFIEKILNDLVLAE